jgi:protein PhnA
MARGREQYKQRQEAIAALGRPLSRRARSRCELCDASGTRLTPFEVHPIPEDPDPDRALMLCDRCLSGVTGGGLEPNEWRFLETSAWSELPPVQVVAVRAVRRLSEEHATDWASDLLGMLYLPPEVEEWLAQG